MDIAIIGAGNVGTALATAFVRAGHHVTIASRDPRTPRPSPQATGRDVGRVERGRRRRRATSSSSRSPFASVRDDRRRDRPTHVAGKVVVDVSNRMSFGADGPAMDTTTSNAEELAALAAGRARRQGIQHAVRTRPGRPDRRRRPARRLRGRRRRRGQGERPRPRRVDRPSAGRCRPARPRPPARGLAFLNITLNIANGGTWQSGWKLVGAPGPGGAPDSRRDRVGAPE